MVANPWDFKYICVRVGLPKSRPYVKCRGRYWVRWLQRPTRIPGLTTLLALGAVLSGCSTTQPQSYLDPKGPVAQMQYDLLNLSMWFAGAIGLVIAALTIYVVLRFRARPGQKGVPEQIHGSTKLEITWTLIPILILIIIGVPTVRAAWLQAAPADQANAMTIKATGYQWWFSFEYPDKKVTTANELWIPVGRPVIVQIESKDVIHSFWVPKLAGKMDMIPGRTNEMWLQADEAGEYYGQCAEFCGASHARMRFRVKAVTQAEFDAWIAARQKGAVQPAAGTREAAGKAILEGGKNGVTCFACHAIDGSEKAKGLVGPNLSNVGARTTIAAGVMDNTDEHMKQWIQNPQSVKPGAKMPPFEKQLTAEELDAVVAYLRSLK